MKLVYEIINGHLPNKGLTLELTGSAETVLAETSNDKILSGNAT